MVTLYLSCYWPAQWASIVLLAGLCRSHLSSSVMLPVGWPAGRWARGHWAADTARQASTVTSH